MNRFLNGSIAIETKNARLNGSSRDAEDRGSSVQNISYTKKIRNRNGVFPYASGVYVKKNIKRYALQKGMSLSSVRSISTTEAVSEGDPYANYDEDIMGFMIASKLSLSPEEYADLDKEQQKTFKKITKGKNVSYEKNITKKRKARLMVSPLQAISSTQIQQEFNVRETDKTNLLYTKEIYSNIMSLGFNLDIKNVGVFRASEDETGFRDYSVGEINNYDLKENDDGMIYLDNNIKLDRIETTLRAIQYFNTDIAQTNNLEDLNTKFVIMSEYSIGNNVFNNIFRRGNLDIDYLIEAIDENENYRISPIYIGIRKGFMIYDGKDLRDILGEKLGDNSNIIIDTVGEAFNSYIDFLKSSKL